MQYLRFLITTFTLIVSLALANSSQAHDGRGGFGRGDGLFGLGHHSEGVFGGRHSLDPAAVQMRFETKFSDISADYDDGLANITDFYTTEDYQDVVDRMERLVDRYDGFVLRTESYLDLLGTSITSVNGRQTYYDELLAEYQARTDLSAERLAKIESRIDAIQLKLTDRLDWLTTQQTSITDLLPTYQTYQTTLGTYLTDIIAAGTGGSGEEATLGVSAGAAALVAANLAAPAQVANLSAAAAVPEPGTAWLAVLGIVLGGYSRWGAKRDIG